MRCNDFLQHYSDYRDGVIADPALYRALRRHVAGCHRCMRYDARIARGALVLRTAREIEPSSRMRRGLRGHLAVTSPASEPAVPSRASLMAGLMLVAGIVLVLWQFSGDPDTQQARAPSTAPRPLVTFPEQAISGFTGEWRAPPVTRTATEAWGDLAP